MDAIRIQYLKKLYFAFGRNIPQFYFWLVARNPYCDHLCDHHLGGSDEWCKLLRDHGFIVIDGKGFNFSHHIVQFTDKFVEFIENS